MFRHIPRLSDRVILVSIIALYLGSFLLPVFDAGTPRAMYGYEAFFFAFISIAYLPAWLANPAFWVSCFYFTKGRWRAARNTSGAAVLLAFSQAWLWDDRPDVGFWLWGGSMGALVLFSCIWSRPVRSLVLYKN